MSSAVTRRPSPATRHLVRRHRAERRFRLCGLLALGFSGLMLLVLLGSIVRPGISGLMRHQLRLEVSLPADGDMYAATHTALIDSLPAEIRLGVEVDPAARHQLFALAGTFSAFTVRNRLRADPDQSQVWVPFASNADLLLKGRIDRDAEHAVLPLSDAQLQWLDFWQRDGRIRLQFNDAFFRNGDSRAPESAGFGGSVVGSLLMLMICLGVAVPVAIAAAVTLEEFATKNRLTGAIEIAINNLAAVPSIIYGLLGVSVFLQMFHLPRSSPLVGGMTLAMLILPVMIIAARAAIRAVPPSMRQAATALGATPLQVVQHHVLPYALPGILTGIILSICRALGETAPLLMIGMVAFVADIPQGFADPATSMPVQIYLWASSPELGFLEKTSSGILVLLVVLLLLNMAAIRLRHRSQLVWS